MPDALDRTLPPTRRVLGDVDPAQPLDTTHPLLKDVENFYSPLPRVTGGSKLYDLSPYSDHSDGGGLPYQAEFGDLYFQSHSNSGRHTVNGSVVQDLNEYSFLVVHYLNYTNSQPLILNNRTGFNELTLKLGTFFDSSYPNSRSYELRWTDSGNRNGGVSADTQYGIKPFQQNVMVGQVSQPKDTARLWRNGTIIGEVTGISGFGNASGNPLHIGEANDVQHYINSLVIAGRFWEKEEVREITDQARRGFPDLLNRRDSVGLLGGGGGGTTPISGTAAITDGSEIVSATGQTEVSGTLSVTDGSETLTINGATKIAGTASITEAAEQISGTGSVITTGSVSITDGGEIISAVSSLQDITGTAQITDAAEDVSATGEVKIAGTATLSDGTEEVVIIGENDISGAVSFADLAGEIAATGSVEVQGSLALTDAGETITARERVPARLATVDVTLEDIIVVHAQLTD